MSDLHTLAVGAVDDGFAELVKSQMESAFQTMAGGESLDQAVVRFENSLSTIKALHDRAIASVQRVIG